MDNLTQEIYQKRGLEFEKIDAPLPDSANYLIQLFCKTAEKYSCGGTKLGKLLSIAAFRCAIEKKILFENPVLKYPNCGATIKGLDGHLNVALYLPFGCQDGKKKVTEFLPNYREDVDIPLKYQAINISNEVKNILYEVFVNFGAFSAGELGQAINPIVEHIENIGPNDELDISNMFTWDITEFSQEAQMTEVVQYLFRI